MQNLTLNLKMKASHNITFAIGGVSYSVHTFVVNRTGYPPL